MAFVWVDLAFVSVMVLVMELAASHADKRLI